MVLSANTQLHVYPSDQRKLSPMDFKSPTSPWSSSTFFGVNDQKTGNQDRFMNAATSMNRTIHFTPDAAPGYDKYMPIARPIATLAAPIDRGLSQSPFAQINKIQQSHAPQVIPAPFQHAKFPMQQQPSQPAKAANKNQEEISRQAGIILEEIDRLGKNASSIRYQPNEPHGTSFGCMICDKYFTRLFNLKSHLKSHQARRPFGCEVCDMRFTRNHDLVRHLQTHTDWRQFVCGGCNKGFIRKDALLRHQSSNACTSDEGAGDMMVE